MQKKLLPILFWAIPLAALPQSGKEGYGPGKRPVFELSEDSVAFAKTSTALTRLREQGSAAPRPDIDSVTTLFYELIAKAKAFAFAPKYPLLENLSCRERQVATEVSIEHRKGRRLPDALFICKNLERLEILNSSVRVIQKQLDELTRLTTVELLNNVPRRRLRFGRNHHIIRVTIKGAKRTSFPRSYKNLNDLERLDVANNSLRRFPGIYKNKKVTFLFAGFNELTLHDLRHKEVPSLEVLDLRCNRIQRISGAIGCFPGLISLALMSNSIHSAGDGFNRLQKLEYLSLYRNELDSIPHAFYNLHALTHLDLYYNHIQVIDPAVRRLQNLTDLHLAYNLINSIPGEIGSLSLLRGIYINNNQLLNLPEELKNLSELKDLRVGNNYLTTFPPVIAALKTLRWLDINNNELKTLPEAIPDFRNLEILGLYGNQWSADGQANVDAWITHFKQQGTKVLTIAPE